MMTDHSDLRATFGRALADSRPRRVQLRRTPGWRKPPGAVLVTRPHSPYANPYPVAEYGRDESLRRYREHLRAHPALVARARVELAGKTLACWCPPDVPCHADVLADLSSDRDRMICDGRPGMTSSPGGQSLAGRWGFSSWRPAPREDRHPEVSEDTRQGCRASTPRHWT
jgi:hypothetical protein